MIGREKESDMPFFNRYSRNPKNQHLQIEKKSLKLFCLIIFSLRVFQTWFKITKGISARRKPKKITDSKSNDQQGRKMKKRLMTLTLVFFFLFTAGCGAKSATPVSAPEGSPTSEQIEETEAPTPTPEPEPIPCNIVFESDRDGNLEIYRMDADGSNQVNLTNNPADDTDPVWSPDGSQIAFVSNRDNGEGGGQFVYVMNADGSNVRQLTFEEHCRMPDWSHDGERIVYHSNDDIYVVEVEGKNAGVNLTNNPEREVNPSWSLDDSKIAWSSSIGDENWHVFVMNADGSNKIQLTNEGSIYEPVWTIDNRIFVGGWDSAEYGSGNFLLEADGSNVTQAGGKGEVEQLIPFYTNENEIVGCVSGAIDGDDEEISLVGPNYEGWFLNLTKNDVNDRNPDWPANCLLGKTARVEEVETEESLDLVLPEVSGDVVMGYTGNQDTMSPMAEEGLLKACNETGIECIKKDTIAELIDLKVDVILSFSNRWAALGDSPTIHDAVEKGIITIVLNAETPETGAINLSIDTDSTQKSIEWMIQEMGGQGKIVFFSLGENETQEKIINSMLEKNPGVEGVIIPTGFDGKPLSEEMLAEMAATNPDLKAIWSNTRNSDIFWMRKNIPVNPMPMLIIEPKKDMLQAWSGLAGEPRGFKGYMTISPGGTGYEGVYAAYFILAGKQIRSDALGGLYGNTLVYDYPIITNENLNEWQEKSSTLQVGLWDMMEIPPMSPSEIYQKWFE